MQFLGLNRLCRATVNGVIQTLRTKSTTKNLAYKIYGPSPTPFSEPIIVLHDCLGTKKNWDIICKRLNGYCKKTVIAVDARNHGDSANCFAHNYTSLAEDVSELISNFVLKRCIIIGHSMGGRTGMMVALNEPSRVTSLVVVDTSPVSTSSYMKITIPKIIDVLMSVNFKGLNLKEAKAAARKKIEQNGLLQTEAEKEGILMNIEELSDKSIGWKYNLQVLKEQCNNMATLPDMGSKTYPGPTLFLAGKLSFCVPTDDLAGIQKVFPASTLLYIDGVGHNVHVEDTPGFLSAVVQFFDNNSLITTEKNT